MTLQGVYTALVTPFNKDETIDTDATRKLVDLQIAAGIDGLVPMGSTGESPTLSHEAHVRFIEVVIEQTEGRVPIIAGTGSNCTAEAIEMTNNAMECGADASLQVVPYYNKPNQEGLYRHFMTIADAVDIPLILYNIPGRTGRNMEAETIVRLASHPNIIGVKEAAGSMDQAMQIIAETPDDFCLLSGDDNLTLPLMALGGKGVISVASNLLPKEMKELVGFALNNDFKKARETHYRLYPVFKALTIDQNPIPIKYAMSLKGLIQEVYRLPLIPLDDDKKKRMKAVLSAFDSDK